MGIFHGDACGIAARDFHSFHTVIRNPEIGTSAQLLHIVGAGNKIVHRHRTVGSGGKGRSGNGLGTGSIRIHAEAPAGQVFAGIGSFLDFQAAGYQLIYHLDGDGHIGRIFGQGNGPGCFSAGLVTIGECRFHNLVSTQGQLAGLGIAAGIGGADGVLVTGFPIGSGKAGTCQSFAVGITFLHFNVAGVIFHVVHIQMVPGHRRRGLGAGIGHVLHGADLRAAGVAHMDDEVILAPVGTAGSIHVIGSCIDRNVGKAAVLREDNDITGNQIGIGGRSTGVLGHAGTGLGCELAQGIVPDRYAGQVVHIVIPVICACLLDFVVDHAGIHAFDIGKVVAQVIGNKGGTDQTVLLEEGDIGCSAGCSTGLRHSLVAIGTLTARPISDIGQNRGCIGLQAGGDIVGNIQIAPVFQPLDIIAGVFQGPEDCIVVHFIGDQIHVGHGRHRIGVLLEIPAGIEVIHGNTVGIGIVRIVGVVSLNRIREAVTDKLPCFRQHFQFIRDGVNRSICFGCHHRREDP